jgi:ornithine cyclodeaminase/alanine dehydrogenase-like protein (mu-crystallin family)
LIKKIATLLTLEVSVYDLAMQFISEADVKRVFTPALALEAARAAFLALAAGSLTMPQRLSLPADEAGVYLVMPCAALGVGLGTKLVTVHPNNAARGLSTIYSSYVLQNSVTGELEAVIEAKALTERRTAAVSALAAEYLARADAKVLGVIGAGPQARAQAIALLEVRAFEQVLLYNRSADAARDFLTELEPHGVPVMLALNLEHLVRESDMISSATRSDTPLILGSWLRSGQHLDLVGAFTPKMLEADSSAVKLSTVVVDNLSAAQNGAGELIQAALEGWDWNNAQELSSLVAGVGVGRSSSQDISLFKSVGLAIEDLFAARAVLTALGVSKYPS